MLQVRNLTKIYKLAKKDKGKQVVALNNVSIDFPDRGMVFLLGKSGSGKSTLLNAIGGLDTFDEGEIIIKGKSSENFKQSDFDSYRNTYIGFIFQEYNILEEFTIGKNLELALELQGKNADRSVVENLLEEVDLKGFYKRKPNQLSGGQKQRVAIARALIKNPEIIMADEPTGALDSRTGTQVMETLKKLSKNKLVIVVTHDREFAEYYGDRIIELKDGSILTDETKKEIIAKKSESGVSFIDNKLVHIKKGQKITKEDMLRIGKMMIENSKNQDTIISFEDETNKDIKRIASINDEGNKEDFFATEKNDVVAKEYRPGDFKSIKSKLKVKDSFKMGASSLKHKPIRLIFTILLSMIAFTMFGLVNTMACFDKETAVYESLDYLNVKNIAVSKYNEGDFKTGIDLNDLENLNKNSNNKFYPVIYQDAQYHCNTENSYNNNSQNPLKFNIISGIMGIDSNIMDDFSLKTIEGNLPENSSQICISKNIYKNLGVSFEDLKTLKFSLYLSHTTYYYDIVGVIEDDTDISSYEGLTFDNNGGMSDYMKREEADVVASYGLVNAVYVDKSTFDQLSLGYVSTGGYVLDCGPDTAQIDIGNVKTATIGSEVLLKSGMSDYLSLKGNQVLVSRDRLDYFMNDTSEVDAKLNNGESIKIYLYDNYDRKDPIEFELVGVYSCYNGQNYADEMVFSEEAINTYFGKYDYALARKGSDLKGLVQYVENYDDKGNRLGIQFASTPILEDFSSTIMSVSKVLVWVAFGLACFSGFMLMNFISTSISYKKREIGVLRAIGARGKDVFFIFFAEAFVICAINFLLSTVACGIVASIINKVIIEDLGFTVSLLSFGMQQVLLLLVISVGVAFASSFFPVYRIAKKNPIDSINNR